jgi:hypothetical protein
MSSTLIVSFVMASVFTAGCVLIQRLERYAQRVGEPLGAIFLVCTLFCLLALVGHYAGSKPPARVQRTAGAPVVQALQVNAFPGS